MGVDLCVEFSHCSRMGGRISSKEEDRVEKLCSGKVIDFELQRLLGLNGMACARASLLDFNQGPCRYMACTVTTGLQGHCKQSASLTEGS